MFIRISRKDLPTLFVGNQNSSYALHEECSKCWQSPPPHWWVPENRAKVWTRVSVIRRAVTYATGMNWSVAPISQYEAVLEDGTRKPLRTFLSETLAP